MEGSGDNNLGENENVSMELGTEPEPMDLNVSTSEESKGGIKYEVLLEEPKAVTPLRTKVKTPTPRPLSAEVIQMKIAAATERRKSLETLRLASLNERLRRVQETAKKHQDDLTNFSLATKENLEQKIEVSSAKRETIIADIMTKLSNHNNHLQDVRQNMIQNEEKAREEIISKLEAAEKNREKLIQEKLESLKKHDERVELVRNKRNSVNVTETEVEMNGNGTNDVPQQ